MEYSKWWFQMVMIPTPSRVPWHASHWYLGEVFIPSRNPKWESKYGGISMHSWKNMIYIYIMYNHPQVIISGEEKRQRWKIFEVYRSPKCKNYPSPRLSPCFSEIVSPDGPSCLLLLLKALILDEPRHSREFQCCFCSLATWGLCTRKTAADTAGSTGKTWLSSNEPETISIRFRKHDRDLSNYATLCRSMPPLWCWLTGFAAAPFLRHQAVFSHSGSVIHPS